MIRNSRYFHPSGSSPVPCAVQGATQQRAAQTPSDAVQRTPDAKPQILPVANSPLAGFYGAAQPKKLHIGVVGGGIAGATAALYLSQFNTQVTLFEAQDTLVNGPPFCHIHAGGSSYPQISDDDAQKLLLGSIEFIRAFPHTPNPHRTVFALRKESEYTAQELLARGRKNQELYQALVQKDANNQVLGDPNDYVKAYSRADVERLAQRSPAAVPQTSDEWLVAVAKNLELDALQFPILVSAEPGISALRAAATLDLALQKSRCTVHLSTSVEKCEPARSGGWILRTPNSVHHVDVLVNAAGYQTGKLRDSAGVKRPGYCEFKLNFLAKRPYNDVSTPTPEVILVGPRQSNEALWQPTPYPGGYVLFHYMADNATLFPGGRLRSLEGTSYPGIPSVAAETLAGRGMWLPGAAAERFRGVLAGGQGLFKGLEHVTLVGISYGVQQISGDDSDNRASTLEKDGDDRHPMYSIVIVKAVMAVRAAQELVEKLRLHKPGETPPALTTNQSPASVQKRGRQLAAQRGLPPALADYYPWDPKAKSGESRL